MLSYAVIDGVHSPVKEVVLCLKLLNKEGTFHVVVSATIISARESTQLCRLFGRVAWSTPFGRRHSSHVPSGSGKEALTSPSNSNTSWICQIVRFNGNTHLRF